MTALTAGGAGMFPRGASDLRSSARANLRRGLAASAALHLVLLAIILRASGGGDAIVRTYTRTTVLQPPCFLVPAPPLLPLLTSGAEHRSEKGIYQPTTGPDIPTDPIDVPSPGHVPVPGEPAGPTTNGHEAVLPLPSDGPPDGVYTVVDEEPVAIFAPTPAYPPWARDAEVTGRVVLNVLVGKDGRVLRAVIVKNANGLGESARVALLRWVFRPARVNGAAVTAWVSIPVVFRL